MFYYRLTKYNPNFRDSNGVYTKNEWTSIYDLEDYKISLEEYIQIENTIIETLLLIFKGLNEFALSELEINSISSEACLTPEMTELFKKIKISKEKKLIFNKNEIGLIISLIIRETIWAKIEASSEFIHFGYDLYVYIGLINKLEDSFITKITEKNLFIEEFQSPYL